MLSFFSRRQILFNSVRPTFYDTQLSKYVIDTTNKIKGHHNLIPYTNISKQVFNVNKNVDENVDKQINEFMPIISILSFLAGYYLSKYNN